MEFKPDNVCTEQEKIDDDKRQAENKSNPCFDLEAEKTYFIEVITEKYPEVLQYGEKYKVLGKNIPTYCTKEDIKIISQSEYDGVIKEKKEEEEINDIIKQQFLLYKKDEDGKDKVVGVDIQQISEYIVDKYNIRTVFQKKKDDIYIYKNGYFQLSGRGFISNLVEKILEEHSKNNVVREIIEKIKRMTEFSFNGFTMKEPYLVCIKNGVLNLKNGSLLKHSPDYNFISNIELTYNKEAECPIFMKFIEETLYPDDIPLMQEWFGFQLWRQYFKKKATFIIGPKDTAKTTLLNTMIKFVGEKNVSGLSIQQIAKGKPMHIFFLHNKHSNVFDDLSPEALEDEGGFKMACGGGYLNGEEKFGDQFPFKTFAKITSAANITPHFTVTDPKSTFERIMLIRCDNVVKYEDQDDFIIDKMTTSEELSGILNWALEGIQRLLCNNKFSYKPTWEETERMMKSNSIPLASFCENCLEYSKGSKVVKSELYQLYEHYCKENTLSTVSRYIFGRQLENYAKYAIPKNYKDRIWEDVAVKPKFFNTFNTFKKNIRVIEKVYIKDICKDNISLDMYSADVLKASNNDNSNTKDDNGGEI